MGGGGEVITEGVQIPQCGLHSSTFQRALRGHTVTHLGLIWKDVRQQRRIDPQNNLPFTDFEASNENSVDENAVAQLPRVVRTHAGFS